MKYFASHPKFPLAFIIALILGTTVIYQSCVKDLKHKKFAGIEYDPNLAVPLVYSSLTVKDILAAADQNGNLHYDQDNFVTLIYKGNLFSVKASDFLIFPDTSTVFQMNPPGAAVTALNSIGSASIPFSENIAFNTGGSSRADSIVMKSGTLTISYSSDLQYSGSMTLSVPGMTHNGTALSMNVPIVFSGGSASGSANVDLTGYTIAMNTPHPPDNQLTVNATITLNGSPGSASSSNNISVSQSFSNLKFSKFFGYIDQPLLSPNRDTVPVDIFKNSLGTGAFTLVDPKFTVNITNSYGVPINATFEVLEGYNPGRSPSSKSIIPVAGGTLNIPINSPTISQIGQSVTSSFTLDKTNSNIVDVIAYTPPNIIYKVHSQANPAGPPTPPNTNFVLDTSRFKVDMEITMPLYGTAYLFSVQDTVNSFTLASPDQIESLLFRTYVSNGFPTQVEVQVYFADSAYNRLDSMITAGMDPVILPAADVDANGVVSGPPKTHTTDCKLTRDRVAKLGSMKYLLVRANAMTTNQAHTNVKIYSTYSLDVRMGMQAQLKIKIPLSKK